MHGTSIHIHVFTFQSEEPTVEAIVEAALSQQGIVSGCVYTVEYMLYKVNCTPGGFNLK